MGSTGRRPWIATRIGTEFDNVEDLQKLGRGRMEAATASAAALSRGFQQTSDVSGKR